MSEERKLPKLLRPVIVLGVAPLLLLIGVATNSLGLVGVAGYIVVVFVIVCWNFAALWRAIAKRKITFRGLLHPINLSILLAYVYVFVVWGIYVMDLWSGNRSWYALGYAVATAVAIAALVMQPETRRMRNHLIVVYNLIGAFAVGAWAAADAGFDGGVVLTVAAQGWGIAQALVFFFGAYFAPIFFLPPVLVLEPRDMEEAEAAVVEADGRGVATTALGREAMATSLTGDPGPSGRHHGPLRRITSLGVDMALAAMVVLLILFSVMATSNLSSWNDLPDPEDATYTPRDDFEFAAMGRAFTDRHDPVNSWKDVVADEVDRASDLGLDLVRYDLHRELLDNEGNMAKLDQAVASIRAAGMDVILAPFGSGRWDADHPSFAEYVEEIGRETMLLVERYEPAWVFPFFEPNGQAAILLDGMRDVEDWVPAIDALGQQVRAASNRTRLLMEVAMEPEQGLDLIEALSAPGLAIDAIGVDPYPLNTDLLDELDDYRAKATNPELGFWISEFGVETVLSGQAAQARALSYVISVATGELNATGICVWSLLDDTVLASNLGLVSRDGTPKEAYYVLRDAIAEVRSRT